MKMILVLTTVALCLGLTGCTPTQYTKSIEVHKDAHGNITETIIVERVIQPNREALPFEPEYLKLSN